MAWVLSKDHRAQRLQDHYKLGQVWHCRPFLDAGVHKTYGVQPAAPPEVL